jgi:hypothetical protein
MCAYIGSIGLPAWPEVSESISPNLLRDVKLYQYALLAVCCCFSQRFIQIYYYHFSIWCRTSTAIVSVHSMVASFDNMCAQSISAIAYNASETSLPLSLTRVYKCLTLRCF